MADEIPAVEPPKPTVGAGITSTAEIMKSLMKNFGFNFAQSWTIVKDGMDRQQHFQDNQVRLLLGGYQNVESEDDTTAFVEEVPEDDEGDEETPDA